MKILLDENLPLKVNYDFGEKYSVSSVKDLGWEGIKNGELLKLAVSNNFEFLITMDRNIIHQQNLKKFGITLILLRAANNRVDSISEFVPKIRTELAKENKKNIIEIN